MAKQEKYYKENIVGVDEAGRGPLAGPVVACAVTFVGDKKKFLLMGFRDSKKLSERKRERLYKKIITTEGVFYKTAAVSEKIIDKINILEATKMAMERAVNKLNYKERKVVIDGNFTLNLKREQEAVKGADDIFLECMVASVIAKVERDRIMNSYHKKYPLYGFNCHKGYGTKKHYSAIKKHGHSDLHRKTFRLY